MVKIEVNGIDLGNNSIKTGKRNWFHNKIKADTGLANDDEVFVFNGNRYLLGVGTYDTNFNKIKKEQLLVTLFAALAMDSETRESFHKIVVGLPMQQYKEGKDDLRRIILNNSIQEITYKGQKRRISIEDVTIKPEGASAFNSLNDDIRKQIGDNDLIIVDIGGRTTNVCDYNYTNGKRTIVEYDTIEFGMLKIYSDIVQPLNAKYALGLTLEDGERILQRGFFRLNGEIIDLNYARLMLANHVNELIQKIRIRFPRFNSSTILLMGGGGQFLEKGFKSRLANVILSNEPIFGNAIAYRLMGLRLYGLE